MLAIRLRLNTDRIMFEVRVCLDTGIEVGSVVLYVVWWEMT